TAGKLKHGWCNEVAEVEAEDFPWTAILNEHRVPTLGPYDPNDTGLSSYQLVFGYDALSKRVVSPLKHYELMSYCGNLDRSFEWPSKHTYEALAKALAEHAPPAPP